MKSIFLWTSGKNHLDFLKSMFLDGHQETITWITRGLRSKKPHRRSRIQKKLDKSPPGTPLYSFWTQCSIVLTLARVLSGLLKEYLRELPEPVFSSCLYQMLVDAMGVFLPDDPDGNAKLVFSILDCLPKANRVRTHFKFTKQHQCQQIYSSGGFFYAYLQ